jgi:hypothetical protein
LQGDLNVSENCSTLGGFSDSFGELSSTIPAMPNDQ